MGQVGQHLQPVIDEAGDAELIAYDCLLLALAAEMQMRFINSCQIVKVIVGQPLPRSMLRLLPALRNEMNVSCELAASIYRHERIECARNSRSAQVVISEERCVIRIIVTSDYDSTNIYSNLFICIRIFDHTHRSFSIYAVQHLQHL